MGFDGFWSGFTGVLVGFSGGGGGLLIDDNVGGELFRSRLIRAANRKGCGSKIEHGRRRTEGRLELRTRRLGKCAGDSGEIFPILPYEWIRWQPESGMESMSHSVKKKMATRWKRGCERKGRDEQRGRWALRVNLKMSEQGCTESGTHLK